jgi:hypothetical protein
VLYDYIIGAQAARKVDTGIDAKHLADRQWMMLVLSTLDPDHIVFSRSYMPVVRVDNVNIPVLGLIPNPNGLYDDLPSLTASANGIARTGRGAGLTKMQKLEMQIEAEKKRIEAKNERLRELESKKSEQLEEERLALEERNRVQAMELLVQAERQKSAKLAAENRVMQEQHAQMHQFLQSQEYAMFVRFMQMQQANSQNAGHDNVNGSGFASGGQGGEVGQGKSPNPSADAGAGAINSVGAVDSIGSVNYEMADANQQ